MNEPPESKIRSTRDVLSLVHHRSRSQMVSVRRVGTGGVQSTSVSQRVRATGRDESQSVPAQEKHIKRRDFELPFLEGSLPKSLSHSSGYTRTFLPPYFPVPNSDQGSQPVADTSTTRISTETKQLLYGVRSPFDRDLSFWFSRSRSDRPKQPYSSIKSDRAIREFCDRDHDHTRPSYGFNCRAAHGSLRKFQFIGLGRT